jgi:hypothetical protein
VANLKGNVRFLVIEFFPSQEIIVTAMCRYRLYLLLFVGFLATSPASADRTAEIDAVFDWAEVTYPDLFNPPGAQTQTMDE